MNKQERHETYRGEMIVACVAAAIDLGKAKDDDGIVAAMGAGYMAMRLDHYIEMLEGLVNGEDLVRVQALIAERYKVRSTQK